MFKKKKIFLTLLFVFIGIIIFYVLKRVPRDYYDSYVLPKADQKLISNSNHIENSSRDEVINILSQPDEIYYKNEDEKFQSDIKIAGYTYPLKKIENELLVYRGQLVFLYVYIDKSQRVNYIYVGRT